MAERVSDRVAAVAPSATVAITEKAKALRAAGEPVIGFGAGEPDFPTPAHVVEAAVAAARDPANHRYSPTAGLPELRQAIAAKTLRDSGLAVEAAQVVVTNGGKQAIYEVCQALLDPGDEVLVPAPYWVTYPETVALAGATTVAVSAGIEDGFRVGVDQLEAARTPRTKLLIFTSPSNPTGAVYPAGEVEEIGRWAAEHGIWVLTDEMYEHLVYGGTPAASLPVVAPAAAELCIVVNAVSKSYAMTGWRVGWLAAPADFARAVTRLQTHVSTNVNNVAQRAALAALGGGLDEVAEMRQAFDRRRRLMHGMLEALPGVTCLEPEGAFYAFPSVTGLLDGRAVGGRVPGSSLELAEILLDAAKVAAVPGEAFGAPGYLRFSYAVSDDRITEGLGRLADLLKA